MFEQMAGFWVLWQVTTPHADLWSEKGSSCLGCFQPWKQHGCLKHGLFPISFPRRILLWDAGRGHLNNDCDPFQKFDEGLRNVNASALHIGLTVLDQMVDIRLSWIFLVSNGISSRSGLLDKLSALNSIQRTWRWCTKDGWCCSIKILHKIYHLASMWPFCKMRCIVKYDETRVMHESRKAWRFQPRHNKSGVHGHRMNTSYSQLSVMSLLLKIWLSSEWEDDDGGGGRAGQ